jgi:hypothetical protein
MRSQKVCRWLGILLLALVLVWGCGDGGCDGDEDGGEGAPLGSLAWVVRAGGDRP